MAKYDTQRGGGISHFTQDVNANHHVLRNVKKITAEIIEAEKIMLRTDIDENFAGYPLQAVFGETISIFDLVSVRSDGKFYKTDITQSDYAVAIALEDGNIGESHKILIVGTVQSDQLNFTIGACLYLGSDAGTIVETPPGGYPVQIIGYALSAQKILFFIGKPELSNSVTSVDGQQGIVDLSGIYEQKDHIHDGTGSQKISYTNLLNIPTSFNPATHGNELHSTNYAADSHTHALATQIANGLIWLILKSLSKQTSASNIVVCSIIPFVA